MHIKLTVSREVVGKASRAEFLALADRLQPAVMTMYDLHEHLAVKGHAICCADLIVNDTTGHAKRTVAGFTSAQLVGVDVDHGKAPFEALAQDPFLQAHAAFAYTTPSHTAEHPRYRIVFILESPIKTVEHYKRVVRVFSERYEGDANTRDAVRIWFGSPNANTTWFRKVISDEVVKEMLDEEDAASDNEITYEAFAERKLTSEDLRVILAHIPPQQEHLDWKRTVAGVFNGVGYSQEVCDMLQTWSPSQIPYQRLYENRLKKVGVGTLIYIAKKHGYQPPKGLVKPPPSTAIEAYDAAESWLLASGQFRYNTITLGVEYRDAREDEWEPLSDYYVNSCLRKMRAAGIKIAATKLWEILISDFAHKHNPIAEYFENLPEWKEGDTDYLRKLADCIPVDRKLDINPERLGLFNAKILVNWMVGAVACAIDHKPNHSMMILQGAQGVGKTRFIRYLCPDSLRKNHYYEGSISGEKDDKLVLGRAFIAVDDELESISRKETETIKSIITKGQELVRPPYGRAHVTIDRIVSFAGSVNKRNFLTDETGNRRFPVIAVGGFIDMVAVEAIDIDRCWAQARYFYTANYRYWMQEGDIENFNEYVRPFQTMTMTDDLVTKWVKPAEPDASPVSATDIAHQISAHMTAAGKFLSVDSRLVQQLGKSLSRAGYDNVVKRIDGKLRHGYLVAIGAVGGNFKQTVRSQNDDATF
jgi:hypothetical protein